MVIIIWGSIDTNGCYGSKIKPQLIKKDGSQCVNAREGESCDLYYPPGSVPPGRYYRGYVDIYATVY